MLLFFHFYFGFLLLVVVYFVCCFSNVCMGWNSLKCASTVCVCVFFAVGHSFTLNGNNDTHLKCM